MANAAPKRPPNMHIPNISKREVVAIQTGHPVSQPKMCPISYVLSPQSFFPSHVNDFGIHFSFEQVNESFGQPKPAVFIVKETYIDMFNHISWLI